MMHLFFAVAAITQTILHYLGFVGILLGIVAILFGNSDRGVELLIGGFAFIVLKYVIGFMLSFLVALIGKKEEYKK